MDHLSLLNGETLEELHHPGERDALAKFGYTKERASAEGRLFRNEFRVCLDCTSVVIRRSLQLPEPWDVPNRSVKSMLLGAAFLSVGALLMARYNWSMYVLVPGGAVLLTELDRPRERRRAAERTAAARRVGGGYEVTTCSRCGGERLLVYLTYVNRQRYELDPVAGAAAVDLRCPRCDELTFRDDPSCTWMA